MSEWISVEDRLPEEEGQYLVVMHGLVWPADFLGYGPDKKRARWRTEIADEYAVATHWMPLPEPPQSS